MRSTDRKNAVGTSFVHLVRWTCFILAKAIFGSFCECRLKFRTATIRRVFRNFWCVLTLLVLSRPFYSPPYSSIHLRKALVSGLRSPKAVHWSISRKKSWFQEGFFLLSKFQRFPSTGLDPIKYQIATHSDSNLLHPIFKLQIFTNQQNAFAAVVYVFVASFTQLKLSLIWICLHEICCFFSLSVSRSFSPPYFIFLFILQWVMCYEFMWFYSSVTYIFCKRNARRARFLQLLCDVFFYLESSAGEIDLLLRS